MKPIRIRTQVVAILLLAGAVQTQAQWATDAAVNNLIINSTERAVNPKIISDGSGGAIIAWEDRRSGFLKIYAQRINSLGEPQWTANGVAICSGGSDQRNPAIVPDGTGGAIITWQDLRSNTYFDIYAQRINASGVVQWAADGVVVCTATNDQQNPVIVPVSTIGAIIAWEDYRNGTDFDIYSQYISSSGTNVWTANGKAVSAASGAQLYPNVILVGTAEPIFTWEDSRGANLDIYAQKINSAGTAQWTADGVAVCSASSSQTKPVLAGDGAGGVIIGWSDGRNGTADIYAQRVNTSGVAQWATNGVVVSSASSNQFNPKIIPASSSSAVLVWEDERSGSSFDIYGQRLNSSGVVQWEANGVPICASAGDQTNAQIINDGSTGAIIVWEDLRAASKDVYAQRVNSSGAVQWTNNGVAVTTAANTQSSPSMVFDNNGIGQGIIVTWSDSRAGNLNSHLDVYAQRVGLNGSLCGNVSTPGAITGSQTILAGSSNTYSVSEVVGATSYTWALPTDWTGTSTTNSINTTASGTGGTITVSASNLCGGSLGSANLIITVNKQNQTITFNTLTPKAVGDAAFNLTATTTSNLAISYTSSNTAVATITGSTVTIVGAGTTTIKASQAGNNIFNAATDVERDLVVNKGNQTITFTSLPVKTLGDAPFTLTATASSGLAVSYTSSNTAIATIAGNTVTLVAAGSVTINANQAGDANYNAASQVAQTFCVNPPKPTITAAGINTETPTLTSSSALGNQWYRNDAAVSGATASTLSVTQPGVYKVQVTVGGCSSAFSENFAFFITSESSAGNQILTLYPNPASLRVIIKIPDTPGQKNISIYSLEGKSMEQISTDKSEVEVNTSQYPAGFYLVNISTAQQNYLARFIKE